MSYVCGWFMSLRKSERLDVRKILIFLCCVPIALLALGFFYVVQLHEVLYGTMMQTIKNRSTHAATVAGDRLKRSSAILQEMASRPYISSEHVSMNTKLAILFGEMEKSHWHDMLVVDVHGNAHSIKEKKYDVKNHAYFKKALQGEFALSSIIEAEDGTTPYIAHAVPIYNEGKIAGLLVALESALDPKFSYGEKGKSHLGADLFFVDRQGKYVDQGRMSQASIDEDISFAEKSFLSQSGVDFFEKLYSFQVSMKFKGVESFVCEVPVGVSGWRVFCIAPRDYAIKQMENLWYFSIAFIVFLLFGLLVCVLYLLKMRKVFKRYNNLSSCIIDSGNIFYLDIDLQGNVHFANEYFYNYMGWTSDKQNNSLLDYMPSSTAEKLQELLRTQNNFILTLAPENNKPFQIQCTAIPYVGQKNMYLLLGVDATAQKNALEMEMAAKQMAELQQIINSLPHGLMVHSYEGVHLINKSTMKIMGLSHHTEVREAVKRFMGDEFFEKQMQMIARVLHHGITESSMFEFSAPNGEKYVFRNIITPVYDEGGHIKYAVNIAIDITENMKLQRQLETEVHRVHEILDSSPSGFLYTSDKVVRYCNPAMYKMGKGIVVGQHLPLDVMGIEKIGEEIAAKVSDGINVYDVLVDMVGDDNNVRKLSLSVVGTTWSGTWHNMVWADDVTAIHDVQTELMFAKDEAERAARAKSDFLATMSHEIRTPMNAVLGFLHVFDKSNLSVTQLNYIEKITISAKGLLRIINDILDFSKIEANKMALERVPFNLYTNIDAVYSITYFSAKEKGLEFHRSIDTDVPELIIGDGERLNQVLLNLLSNAIKFTERGSVSLHVCIKEKIDDSHCILECRVKDTGIGLSAEQAAALFQPFTQADTSTSRKFGGTGLGLAISKRILQLMDGDISLQSTLGQGAEFICTLPVQVASKDMLEEKIEMTSFGMELEQEQYKRENMRGKKVLVVEDNLINQEIAAAMMEEYHLDIQFANHGLEAVQMFQKEKYDLIFMDLQMPTMNGLEATKTIRNLDLAYAKEVPIVAMTANVMHEDRQACEDAGMNAHIGKPISPQLLQQTLEQWLLREKSA